MTNFKLCISFVAICIATEVAGLLNKCTVTLKNGTINGWTAPTLDPSKKACVYFSIPYARPPVGSLRFQPPEPLAQPWTSPLDGSSLPNVCPQKGKAPKGAKFSEDCLYLNVYQPVTNRSKDQLLPVLIWFHGGAFTIGSAYLYSPARILSHGDVIFVTLHYRLGLLGFLSTGDETSPGNYGLKDQALSIRWVHENIGQFGGDPKKMTIFGESAGGASVVYQLISPLNKGLLSGVIAQSGTALSHWALDKEPKKSAQLMAKRLGCTSNKSEAMVSCLRKLPWKTIIDAQEKYTHDQYSQLSYPLATMVPVVEPNIPGAFISEEPEVLMKTGDIPTDIPVMMGANKHDGSFILGLLYFAKLAHNKLGKNGIYLKEDFVPDLLKFFGVKDEDRGVASKMEKTYLDGVNRSSWEESMPGLVDLVTVLSFKSSIQNTVKILSERNKKVYLYSFEHHSNNTLWAMYFGKKKIPVEGGIAHADELMYIFNVPHLKFSERDKAFSELFCELWLNFAKFGNPTQLTDKRYENWLPYNPSNEPFMKLNGTPTMQYGYRNSWHPNGFQWN